MDLWLCVTKDSGHPTLLAVQIIHVTYERDLERIFSQAMRLYSCDTRLLMYATLAGAFLPEVTPALAYASMQRYGSNAYNNSVNGKPDFASSHTL